ncbi:major capsid protein [Streptomyces sp. NPDC087300]|uniref:major capsid protein n=1 Tax=Streptomyces sp. NPDC087300 TaxID=3365780 RepID=UPI0038061C39
MPKTPAEILALLIAPDADHAQILTDHVGAGGSLDDVRNAAAARFNELRDRHTAGESPLSSAELGEVRALGDSVQAASQVEQQAADVADMFDSVGQMMEPPAPVEEAPAEQAVAAEVPAQGTEQNTAPAEVAAAPVTEGAPSGALEPVAAASREVGRVPLASLASDHSGVRRAAQHPDTGAPPASPWSITASAGSAEIPPGKKLDFEGLVTLTQERLSALSGSGVSGSSTIAKFTYARDPKLVAAGPHDHQVVDYAGDESRLPGGSLTAAVGAAPPGDGWCSPSETDYSFCADESTLDGILALPTITVRHGGIRWPLTPDWEEVFKVLESGTWDWTAEDFNKPVDWEGEGGSKFRPQKPCANIPCPDWEELRLLPRGLCISADILQNHAWPELLPMWIQRLMKAYAHKVNAGNIQKILSLVKAKEKVAVGPTAERVWPYGPGATSGLLETVEVLIEDVRESGKLSPRTTLETVLPYWVRGLLRADLSKREGVDLLSMSNARIDSLFAERGAKLSFVRDWQPLRGKTPDAVPTSYPNDLQVLMYQAGAFVAAREDVIRLNGVHDAAQLRRNVYTALFMEEAAALGRRCGAARLLDIKLCPNGVTTGGLTPEDKMAVCPPASGGGS